MKTIILSILILHTTACTLRQITTNEIIFYSNGSTFAPQIKVDPGAQILWTWNDSTTSTFATPIKEYGSAKIRVNKLKVTPWSALKQINIGYDAQDGGSDSIEFVPDQMVSKVCNLDLVAPYLTGWYSSYNHIDSLNFVNFTNLEVIECYESKYLQTVVLKNNLKLRRICLEKCDIKELDISQCLALEDIRGAENEYTIIPFSINHDKFWHICIRDNPQLTNTQLFKDVSSFINLSELYIWNTNQAGLFSFHTNNNKNIDIRAHHNGYTSIDLTGSLQNPALYGYVDLKHNDISSVNIENCVQINKLNLSENHLNKAEIDKILKQLDDFNTRNGIVDLRNNSVPSDSGRIHIENLINKSWTVLYDKTANPIDKSVADIPFLLYPNPASGRVFLKILDENLLLQRINVFNSVGQQQSHKVSKLSSSLEMKIDLINCPASKYYLKILADNKMYFEKIILQ